MRRGTQARGLKVRYIGPVESGVSISTHWADAALVIGLGAMMAAEFVRARRRRAERRRLRAAGGVGAVAAPADAARALPRGLARVLVIESVFLAALAGVWVWQGRGWEPLGFRVPESGLFYLCLGATLAYVASLLAFAVYEVGHLRVCAECRADMRKFTRAVYGGRWAFRHPAAGPVAAASGVWEELVFRGFLFWLLTPMVGEWGAMAISAAAFGAGHLPQGRRVALFSLVAGVVLGVLAILSETVWVPMVLHAGHNAIVCWLLRRALAMESEPALADVSEPESAAA